MFEKKPAESVSDGSRGDRVLRVCGKPEAQLRVAERSAAAEAGEGENL